MTTLEDIRNEARKKLKGICGVYRICDGGPNRVCQGHSYGSPIGIGGAGTGASFHNNIKALKAIKLHMKTVEEEFTPTTETILFGKKLSMPIMGAPVTNCKSFGGEEIITEKDFCLSTVKGCKEAGTIGFRGDSYIYDYEVDPPIDPSYDAIKAVDGWGIKIVKPRAQEVLKKVYRRYEQLGVIAVGTDVDGCGSLLMSKWKKPVYHKSINELKDLVDCTSLPFIAKGVMTVEDAEKAVEAGVDAIVVSNHGGRVLDHTPGTAAVLPKIAQAVGDKVTVLIDGGIRTGYDILKVLALGADGCLNGRDVLRAAVGGHTEGVKMQMEYFRSMLAKAMKMTGCETIQDITADILM